MTKSNNAFLGVFGWVCRGSKNKVNIPQLGKAWYWTVFVDCSLAFPTSLCGVLVLLVASRRPLCDRLHAAPLPHLILSSHTTHLTTFITHKRISHTTHLTHNSCHSSHTTHLTPLISHGALTCGRRSTQSLAAARRVAVWVAAGCLRGRRSS